MLQNFKITLYAIIIALFGLFFTPLLHAQGIFGNNSSSSQTNIDNSSSNRNQTSIETNTTNNTTNNTMIDSSQDISNTNTTDNSSIINLGQFDPAMGDPNIPPPMGDPNQDMYNVDNSQVTDQAGPRWVQDIDWAACVQQRFNDGESFMASRRACK